LFSSADGLLADSVRYLQINTGPWPDEPLPWWCRLLKRVIPSGNLPEVEKLFAQTVFWWLEIDEEGNPQREIGFNAQREPVVLGPVGDHIGFLTDVAGDWRSSDEDSIEAAREFEGVWHALWPKFEHLEDGRSQRS